ncbi:hypothetical protein O4H49_16520 [Kiloniella laminariae]|uniref:Uncharacterized protein n=1 Tax=Kiloniella laminariae TaxID=454162 RepID=A0ABT4LMT1_9PROT|nr:hypothetical protein [Kiloniella laminariae]MCZ4282393.1 hypothetical protein [Kiloniella laminariae]
MPPHRSPLKPFSVQLSHACLTLLGLLVLIIGTTMQSHAEETKKFNQNEVIEHYGKIATGLALEERCNLLPPQDRQEYYWQQYQLEVTLNQIFTNAPVLPMIRSSALQVAQGDTFTCDQKSGDFIRFSLLKAGELTYDLTGQTYAPGESDLVFNQDRLLVVADAAGTNILCQHLLPEYAEQLSVGYKALRQTYLDRYPDKADPADMDDAFESARTNPASSCNEDTRRISLQGWQLTRMIMSQLQLSFEAK